VAEISVIISLTRVAYNSIADGKNGIQRNILIAAVYTLQQGGTQMEINFKCTLSHILVLWAFLRNVLEFT
jgi:hypothetical protein